MPFYGLNSTFIMKNALLILYMYNKIVLLILIMKNKLILVRKDNKSFDLCRDSKTYRQQIKGETQ